MAEDFEITGGDSLRSLGNELRRVGAPGARNVKTGLRKKLRAAAGPAKTAVQRNAEAIPTRSGRSTGLRRSISRATKIKTTTTPRTVGVRVYVDPKAMPAGQEKLPALMEGRGWSHKTFGHEPTVFQPGHAYFKPATDPLLPAARTAALAAVDEATQSLRNV